MTPANRREPVQRVTAVMPKCGGRAPAVREFLPDFFDVAAMAFVSMPAIKSQVLKKLTSVGNVTVRFMPFIFKKREWEGGRVEKIL
jgi:hypothetical protein